MFARQEAAPASPAARRHTTLLLLLLLAAVVLPRAYALRGLQYTSTLNFEDMKVHLLNTDILTKDGRLEHTLPKNQEYFNAIFSTSEVREPTKWPWGVYRVAGLFSPLFGIHSIWTVQATNLLFLIIMLAGVVLLGQALGGLRLGLWGALLTALCPPLLGGSWYLSLDFPLAAMVPVGLYLLLLTDGFRRAGPSLGLGLWAALAMYIKMTFPLYLLVPSLWALGMGLRRSDGRSRVLLNLVVSVLMVLGVSLLLGNLSPGLIYDLLSEHLSQQYVSLDDAATKIDRWSLRGLLTPARFAWLGLPWPLLLVSLPGLLQLHRRRSALRGRWLLLCTLWGGYLALALMEAKMHRYNLPLYPALCLATAAGLHGLLPRRWRAVGLIWAATTFLALAYLVHVRPTPWGETGPSLGHKPMHFDMRPPAAHELRNLRLLGLHPHCDMVPVVKRMARLVAKVESRGPIILTHTLCDKDPLLPELDLNRDGVTAMLAHYFPDRLVSTRVFSFTDDPEEERHSYHPVMVLLHAPSFHPLKLYPRHPLRLAQQKKINIRCWWKDYRLHPGLISVLVYPPAK